MKARTKKLVHMVWGAVSGSATDIAAQLAGGQLINPTRTVIVGLVVGLLVRAGGAFLAWLDTSDVPEPPAS
jgi:hypothetical protein